MVLSDVEAALERMDQGRYGLCQVCARPIPLERLTVVPQARYCGRCPRGGEAGR
jgi:RNA polymerase-binding transcription factor DksA